MFFFVGTPDVKSVSDSDPDPEYDWWIQDLNLEQSDLHILSCDQELNDKLINAAQTLLSRQYPTVSGFQSTLLGTKLGFKPIDSDAALGVQIFHTGKYQLRIQFKRSPLYNSQFFGSQG